MDPTIAVLIGLFMGVIGGFLNSILGWLASNEAFSSKKNIGSIIIAVLAGLSLTLAAVQLDTIKDPNTPEADLIIVYALILLSAVGLSKMGRDTVHAVDNKLIGTPAASTTVVHTTDD